jgi:hypothetical protein
MTLLIAYIMMDHIGGFGNLSYIGVFLLWLWHIGFHAD